MSALERRSTLLVRFSLVLLLALVSGHPLAAQGAGLTVPASPPRSADAPPLTVADLIGLTRLSTNVFRTSVLDGAIVSPDGRHQAVVVHRGNLARNTRDFALLVFRTNDLLRRPRADTVAVFRSSSNRPAIDRVQWLDDNATLVFLAEQPGGLPQVYTFDLRTRTLTQRTRVTAEILDRTVHMAAVVPVFVYQVATPPDTTEYSRMRAGGFVVSPHAFVSDIIAGDWQFPDGPSYAVHRRTRTMRVARDGGETAIAIPDSAAGYRSCDVKYLQVAPSGDLALLPCTPLVPPADWRQYHEAIHYLPWETIGEAKHTLVVDLRTGRFRPLMNAPRFAEQSLMWAPNSRSVVVANAALPLDVSDRTERAARLGTHHVAEVDVGTGAVTVIARRDSLVVSAWDPATNTVAFKAARQWGTAKGAPGVWYRKTAAGWVAGAAAARRAGPALVIDEGVDTPWRLVAVDPKTQARRVVYDPNPGFARTRRLAPVTVVHWRTRAGAARYGGLYWPADYVPGRRYPLVIQTHGFDSTLFEPSGLTTSGYAAQPLANAGLFVLQVGDFFPLDDADTEEGPTFQDTMEGAIAALDSLGLIDRAKLGMHGFSRTCFHVLYFLTHSRVPLAAATIVDGIDMSYLQNLVWANTGESRFPNEFQNQFAGANGGPPFGDSLKLWMERAPGFNLHRVTAALQATAIGWGGLLAEWEPYAGLRLQGKPAELVYVPDGAHNLAKPSERLTVQQGVVDWYRFWLQGYEDPASDKQARYGRWRQMRAQHDAAATAKEPRDAP